MVLAIEKDYLVAAKPAGMHTAPLRPGEDGTLLAWLGERHPEVLAVRGRKPVEGGLLHRLDRETSGLVLVARSQAAYDALLEHSEAGGMLKRYRARCIASYSPAPGQKDLLAPRGWDLETWLDYLREPATVAAAGTITIQSAFRPFGPGRRLVAAIAEGAADSVQAYETRIDLLKPSGAPAPVFDAVIELTRGFRHQIRCHLASIGLPIVGDSLYGPPSDAGSTARLFLHAEELDFTDPGAGESRSYRLPADWI